MRIDGPAQISPVPVLRIGGNRPLDLFETDLSDAAKTELNKLQKATQDIEAVFVKDLLGKLATKSFAGDGAMGDFIRDQFLGNMAEQVSKTGAIGIGKMLKGSLSEKIYRQEAARILLNPQTPETEKKPTT